MAGIALRMLFGDRTKLISLVLGVALCTLLIQQQSSLFVGLMLRSQNVIAEARAVDIWVMDPATEYVDLARPMRDVAVYQVRGVPGVEWAVPFFKSSAPVKTSDGRLINAMLLGIDDASLVGAPRRFLIGSPEDLRGPDAIAIDRVGYAKIWPGEPIRLGRILEINEKRAVVAAITEAAPAFSARALIHTRFSQARSYLGRGRKQLSFVWAGVNPQSNAQLVAKEIHKKTHLKAHTSAEFSQMTIDYYLRKTGIPINFATTVVLGLVVGAAIVGLTFHAFVTENLKQFASLKVIGMRNMAISRMVLIQTFAATAIGFAIGTWLAAGFFDLVSKPTSALRGMYLPWWIVSATAAIVILVVLLSTAASLRRVLAVDPATVLRN